MIQMAPREKKRRQQHLSYLLKEIAELESQHKLPQHVTSEIPPRLIACRE